MEKTRRTQADRSATTRAALIKAGRKLFAEHGFAGVGTEAIVAEAAVSRGALYHQYGDKTELFAAVVAAVEAEICEQLAAEVFSDGGDGDFIATMTRSLVAWLDACEHPDVQRILLLDGPSVLGWKRWRDICQLHILGLITQVLEQGMADGVLIPLPAKPLAHVLLAAADEAALYVGTSARPGAAREDMFTVMGPLLEAFVRR